MRNFIATSLFILLAAGVLFVLRAEPSTAAGNGSITITPQTSTVAVGGAVAVDVVVEPPDGGLSIWIIGVAYDSSLVEVQSCTPLTLPPEGVGATLCEPQNTDGDPEFDKQILLGGYLENQGGTPVGITQTQSFGNIVFRAIGAGGQSTDLVVDTTGFLTPTGEEHVPDEHDGEIIITGALPTPNVGPVGGAVDIISADGGDGSSPAILLLAGIAAVAVASTAFALSRRMIRR